MDEQEKTLSIKEKNNIIRHFILNSPPGEVKDIIRDLKKIVSKVAFIEESFLNDIMRSYNLTSKLPIMVPDGNYKILICEESEIDSNHYIDIEKMRILYFDHILQEFIIDKPITMNIPLFLKDHSNSESIYKVLKNYLLERYSNQGAVFVTPDKNNKNIIHISLCAERINLRNFWSGKWKSSWTYNCIEKNIVGTIDLHVHYFENGNLQLQTSKKIEKLVEINKTGDIGHSILKIIKTEEDSIQSSLEDMYTNMSQETFKEIRRVMPITQTKMDWNLYNHRNVRNLHTGR